MSGLGALAALEGTWSLDRLITHDDGSTDRFEGTSEFTRAGHRLVQDENGWLQPGRGGQPLRASRRYVWAQTGDRIEVSFADMRPFHGFALNLACPTATHLCPPDRYQVAYDFRQFPEWQSVWRVEGPRKAYEMTSVFRRQTG